MLGNFLLHWRETESVICFKKKVRERKKDEAEEEGKKRKEMREGERERKNERKGKKKVEAAQFPETVDKEH